MPRIAAALGVFATLTFCVGFNAVQYPAVWKMVAAPAQSTRPAKPAAPAVSAPPPVAVKAVPIAVPQRDTETAAEAMSKPAPAVPAMASSMPPVGKPVCDGSTGVCRLPTASIPEPSDKKAAGSTDRAAPIGWPKDSPPAKKAPATKQGKSAKASAKKAASTPAAKASPAKAAPATAKATPRPATSGDKSLVPVVRSTKAAAESQDKTSRLANGAVASRGDSGPKMVRPLPPVDDSPPIDFSNESAASDQQIPIYPSTAVR